MDCVVHGIFQARILEWVAFPGSRDLPNPGIEPRSPALQVDSLSAEPQGKPICVFFVIKKKKKKKNKIKIENKEKKKKEEKAKEKNKMKEGERKTAQSLQDTYPDLAGSPLYLTQLPASFSPSPTLTYPARGWQMHSFQGPSVLFPAPHSASPL